MGKAVGGDIVRCCQLCLEIGCYMCNCSLFQFIKHISTGLYVHELTSTQDPETGLDLLVMSVKCNTFRVETLPRYLTMAWTPRDWITSTPSCLLPVSSTNTHCLRPTCAPVITRMNRHDLAMSCNDGATWPAGSLCHAMSPRHSLSNPVACRPRIPWVRVSYCLCTDQVLKVNDIVH